MTRRDFIKGVVGLLVVSQLPPISIECFQPTPTEHLWAVQDALFREYYAPRLIEEVMRPSPLWGFLKRDSIS